MYFHTAKHNFYYIAEGISNLNGHAVRPRVILLSSGFLSGKAEGQWQQKNDTVSNIVWNTVNTVHLR